MSGWSTTPVINDGPVILTRHYRPDQTPQSHSDSNLIIANGDQSLISLYKGTLRWNRQLVRKGERTHERLIVLLHKHIFQTSFSKSTWTTKRRMHTSYWYLQGYQGNKLHYIWNTGYFLRASIVTRVYPKSTLPTLFWRFDIALSKVFGTER